MQAQNDHVLINGDGAVIRLLIELCRRQRWPLVDVLDRDVMKRGFTFATGSDRVELVAVDDRQAGMEYVIVAGDPDTGHDLTEVRTLVAMAVCALDEPALCDAYDRARDRHERSTAVLRLGLAAPPQWSEPTAIRLREAIVSRDKATRSAAVFALHYRLWDRWRPLLEAALERETDPQIAANIETLLRDWNKKALIAPEAS